MSEQTEPQVDQIEAMFVQSAHGLTTSDGSLTFHTRPCSLRTDPNGSSVT
jgi:hypothetical protein